MHCLYQMTTQDQEAPHTNDKSTAAENQQTNSAFAERLHHHLECTS